MIGQTLLRKCAFWLIADTVSDMDLWKLLFQLNLCTVTPSLSVLAIHSCSGLLRFDQWANVGEFDSIIPSNYIDLPTDEGQHLVSEDFGRKLANIYKAVHIHEKLNQGHLYHEFYKTSREVGCCRDHRIVITGY
jgi:hypothetical protein